METTKMKKLPPKPVNNRTQAIHWLIGIITVCLILWSAIGIDFGGIKSSAGQITGAII